MEDNDHLIKVLLRDRQKLERQAEGFIRDNEPHKFEVACEQIEQTNARILELGGSLTYSG